MLFLPNNAILSTKYLNAKIKDAGGRIKFVQVKNYLGDYFITTINSQPYLFKVIDKEVGIYDEWGIKKVRIADFSTKHYRPISDSTDKIKFLMEKNGIGKINTKMFSVLKSLGKREKKNFEKHDIEILIDELLSAKNSKIGSILGRESKYKETAADVLEYLQSLDVEQIVTPTREIAEYIEEDLLTTDPAFFGTVITTHQRTDLEHKKVTNTPVGPKRPFGILLAVIFGILLVIVGIWLLWDNGTFDSIPFLDAFDSVGDAFKSANNPPSAISAGTVAEKYPTPEAAKAAIDRGEAKITDFPESMRPIINSVETPKVSP